MIEIGLDRADSIVYPVESNLYHVHFPTTYVRLLIHLAHKMCQDLRVSLKGDATTCQNSPAYNQSLHVFNLGLWFSLQPQVAVSALRYLIGFAASGQIKVPVTQMLPLSRAAEAHRMIEERRTTGKIILKPWEEA